MRKSSDKPEGSRGPKRSKLKDDEVNSEDFNSDSEIDSKLGDDDYFAMEDDPNSNAALTKKFLEGIGAGEESIENLGERLSREAEMISRKVHYRLADKFTFGDSTFMKGHKLPATCVTISSDERFVYTGGKDCAIIRWDLETGKKDVYPGGRKQFQSGGHFEQVQSICLAEDENLIVSGGADNTVRLWDIRAPKNKAVGELRGHSGAVTGVAAEPGNTRQLFTCSKDRTLRLWNLSMRTFISLMCGHTDDVIAMDLTMKDKPLSVSTDRTVRLWKASNDSHYVFHSPAPGAIHGSGFESVAFVDQTKFVSGGVDGSLALWSSAFKKPIAVAENAHAYSVTAVAASKNSDLAFSGSSDGVIRAWKADQGDIQAAIKDNGGEKLSSAAHKKLLTQGVLRAVSEVKVSGFVNGISVGAKGNILVAAVGKEPRLGRWEVQKEAKNGIQVIRLDGNQTGVMSAAGFKAQDLEDEEDME